MVKNKNNGEIKSEKLFNTLLDYLLDFIIVVSVDGKIKYVSPSFYNSLGYSKDETIGKFIFSFIHPDDLSKTKEDYKILLAKPGTLQNVIIRLLRKDGNVTFVKGSRKNLLDDPEIEGIILTGKDVTEITEANISLEDKNEMLEIQQRLLNVTELISKVGGWEYDVITQKMFWTEEVYRIHEINKNDFEAGSTNHIDKSLECYLPEDRQKILEAFNKCVNKAEPYDLVFPFVTCNGKSLWVRTVAKPVIENNKVVKIIGNIADVTREKRAELLSEARYRLIEFSYHSKLNEFLQKVLDEAEILTRSKIGFYHFVESDQITLSLQAWSTNTIQHLCKAEGKGLHYDVDKAGVWVDCVHQRKTIVHNDYESLTHKKGLPEGHAPVVREVVVPVFREDKIVAILGVGNKNNFYDDDDVEMITKLADLAWDITERKRTEQSLKESEEKYKLLFDASPIGIGISDMNGKIIKSNPVMKEITGYDFENEKDVVVSDMYLHKENRETLLDLLAKNGCARDWEVDLKRKDGSIYNALLNVDLIQIGNEKFILTNMRDISNRKRAEKVLKENEELKQTVLDSLNANVAVVDSKGNIISVNKPWEKFALSNGIKKLDGTVEKINYFDVLCKSVENGEKNADKVFEGIKSVLNGEKEYFETEYPCDSPTEKRWFVMHVLPLVNELGVVISHENITERKIAEDQLRQSEERLKLLNIMQQDQNAELIEKNNELKKARLSTLNIIDDLSREIREHKLAEKALKESESRNRAFLNAIPDLIFILSQDGIFIDYKSEREEELLLAPQNFIGKHLRDVLPEKLALLTLEKIGLLYATGEVQVYDYSVQQNGQTKHYENRLVLSGDNQILSIIRDITSAKESEVQIKRLSHAIEQSKATIIITSVTGNIEYFNPMLTEITGYTFEELKGKSISILGSGNGNDKTEQEMWNTISNGKDWSGEFLNKKKNGELYWSSAVVSPIKNNKDEIVNFIAIQEDITHQKQLTKELIEAKEKAEEMNKVKSYFFANMSHELRTPFVGILGFSEMLAEAIPDPELKNYAEQILKSSKRLTDTLNKILNITRLEFDKYEPETTDVNVNAVLEELTSLYLQTSKNNNTTIKTNLLFDNALIKSDKKLIEEIFTNLISNAVKYTPNGSIEITSRNVVSDNKNILEIIVADTGMGISENMQDIIWQEFRQASEGYSRSFEGTGLGLTITKKYVEILGGKISLKSKLGEGSTFKVQIPFTFSDVKPKVDSNTIKKLPEVILENDIRKPRLLYVEDDAISLNYITIVLKSKYDISTAFSAKIALELVNTNQYDALMLDINLGRGMDGLELMLKIRQIDNYKEIPIVAVTAYAADSDKAEFLAKGFNQYLSKPFTASELTDTLKKIFE